MSTFDRIDLLLKQQKKKQTELTNFLGVTKNAYTDWKSGRIKSYTKHLSRIAEFFDVTVDYLLGKEEKPSAPEGADGSNGDLWAKICRLSAENRNKVDGYVSALLDEQYRAETAKQKNA